MTKEELKNRISMALKDPTLQQGFEVICKENAELKADNDARKFAMAMSEKVEKQLRKENAELKKDMATAIPLLNKAKDISASLDEAEEIIKKLLSHYPLYNHLVSGKEKKEIEEAEAFISE